MVNAQRNLETVSWHDIRHEVAKINPELSQIIDEISPKRTLKLIKATYLYGDFVIDNGIPQYPDPLKVLCELNETQSDIVKTHLSYQNIPLCLTLKNANEVFVNTGERVVPLNLFYQGSLLGVFETINFMFGKPSASKWGVSAGARSIVMLPRITENLGLDRLRLHYQIPPTINLKAMSDHWHFFKAMSQSPQFEQSWQNEVLFFTRDWVMSIIDNPKWVKFKEYLYKQSWEQAHFSIGKIENALQWEVFSEAIAIRNLKPRPYLADHVKHLFSIAAGGVPAFRPMYNQEIAPITGLQDAFLNIYHLKDYIPTIMSINPLSSYNNSLPLYYSLSFPTLLEGSPVDKSTSTIMLDLRKIKLLLDTLKQYHHCNKLLNSAFISHINFDYFHTDKDKRKEIRNSIDIFNEDETFMIDSDLFFERKLCDKSLFWRGCIRVRT